ncbi:MAG TPA: protein kinase [Polyangia bacterium]|nr:protein kinase [Polyangia bacterium]
MADNRYRITERVAAGGMAEVFRGVAESMRGFKKNIAIKRILPSLTKNKKFVAMFLDEARLSLSLQHANIVQVFDIGHSEDTYFIVMEYVDGCDLKAILDWRRRINKRVPVAHSLYVITEICKGLSYAHELRNQENDAPLNIVHRDVSPPNVLLSKQGEVKVVDFGLAKATSQVEVTDPGVVKGKMSYLSPEAARGEEVDSRADIFAVGILLYEMLTGKRLFYGETDYQTVELVRNAKIPPIRPQNPQVEPELEDIVRKSLAKRKEDRFQSATDLQDALAQYSYSRGLKVISRDIAELVRQCLEDKRMQSGEGKARTSIIDHLLQDEIVKFTSVDFEDPGAQPLEDDELAQRPAPSMDGDFVDPRAWADERMTPAVPTPAEVRAFEQRRTARDVPATKPGAAPGGKPPAPPKPLGGTTPGRGMTPPPTPRPGAAPAKGGSTPPTGTRQPAPRTPSSPGLTSSPVAGRAPTPTTTRPRVPTGPQRAVPPAARAAVAAESTPGPETLASVLEPTPGPQDTSRTIPTNRTAGARPARSFLIGALIGTVILGGAVAVVVFKRGATASVHAAPRHP